MPLSGQLENVNLLVPELHAHTLTDTNVVIRTAKHVSMTSLGLLL